MCRQWGTADDVLNHPDVEVVVNLTIPAVHAEVASKAIAAGKHVWTEKPISVDRASGRDLLGRPSGRVCSSGSPRTPSSARACRPHGGPSPAVTSANPCQRRP